MSRFAPALRRTARELDLPRRARAAILLELAADLEAVYAHHRKRGLDEEQAARRAEETVLGTGEVLRRLAALHRPSFREWSEEIGERLGQGTDLLLLVLAVAPMLALAAAAAVPRVAAAPGDPLTWAVIGTAAGVLGLAGASALRLHRGTTARVLRRDLPVLLLLSAVGPALGLLALSLGLQDLAAGMYASGTAADVAAQSTGGAAQSAVVTAQAVAERVGRDGSLLAVGLLVGIAGSVAWFVLMNLASKLEMREVDALLEEGALGPTGAREGILTLAGRRA